jgi:phenylalanyl-tRNA synthetase beta subunit
MKTIIVVRGTAGVGKTSVIKEVYNVLKSTPRCKIINGPPSEEKDIEVTLKYYSKLIGISSMGDPNSDLFNRLKAHAKNNCEVILTASRTSRSTVNDVEDIARKNGYQIIQTSHYYTDTQDPQIAKNLDLNKEFAKGLADLILKL